MWSRKQALAEAPPIDTWPILDESALDKTDVEPYRAKVKALKLYFKDERVAEIERLTGIPRWDLPKLAKKCLLTASDGQIFGFRALLPYGRFRPHKRSAQLKTKLPEERGGYAGALRNFLDRFPETEETLVKLIRQESKAKEVHEFRLRAKDLHRLFIKFAKLKVTTEEWPFNTTYRGLRSIERYMRTESPWLP